MRKWLDNALFNPHVIVLSFIYLNIFEDDCPLCPVYPLYHNYTRAVDITEYCIAIAECPSEGTGWRCRDTRDITGGVEEDDISQSSGNIPPPAAAAAAHRTGSRYNDRAALIGQDGRRLIKTTLGHLGCVNGTSISNHLYASFSDVFGCLKELDVIGRAS